MRRRLNIGKYLTLLFGAGLLAIVMRGVPPSAAQQHTLEDANTAIAVQAHDIDRAHEDIEDVKTKYQKLSDQVSANTTSLSNIDAEVRTIGGVLLLVQVGIGVWKKKASATA